MLQRKKGIFCDPEESKDNLQGDLESGWTKPSEDTQEPLQTQDYLNVALLISLCNLHSHLYRRSSGDSHWPGPWIHPFLAQGEAVTDTNW